MAKQIDYDIIEGDGSRRSAITGEKQVPIASVKDVINTVSQENSAARQVQQAQNQVAKQQFNEDYLTPEIDPLKETANLAGKAAGAVTKGATEAASKISGGFVEGFLSKMQPKTLSEAYKMDAMVAATKANQTAMDTVSKVKPDAVLGVQDQLAQEIDTFTFADMAAQRATQNGFTMPTQDEEYNTRIADMTGQTTSYKEPVAQGGPSALSQILYYGSGGKIVSPGMQEALSFAQKRGEQRGGFVPGVQGKYLEQQAPLGTFEKEQLAQQERLRMSEIGIQQSQLQQGRAQLGVQTMFPGTAWIRPLQPAATREYLEGTDPGAMTLSAEQMRRPVSKGVPEEWKRKVRAILPPGAVNITYTNEKDLSTYRFTDSEGKALKPRSPRGGK